MRDGSPRVNKDMSMLCCVVRRVCFGHCSGALVFGRNFAIGIRRIFFSSRLRLAFQTAFTGDAVHALGGEILRVSDLFSLRRGSLSFCISMVSLWSMISVECPERIRIGSAFWSAMCHKCFLHGAPMQWHHPSFSDHRRLVSNFGGALRHCRWSQPFGNVCGVGECFRVVALINV